MTPTIPLIDSASVKVMRSHDYCHFEVALSSNLLGFCGDEQTIAVDSLRKMAARLADKAVEQYRIAKNNAVRLLQEKQSREYLVERMKGIRETAEGDRTVKDQAELKAYNDSVYEANRAYDYEDDWEQDQ